MKTPGGKVTKYSKFVEMQVVYGLTPDGAAQRSGRIQIGMMQISANLDTCMLRMFAFPRQTAHR
jgi:hypothetical protein